MSWSKQLKILFCIQVFFRLCNAIVSNEGGSMNLEEWKSFIRTENNSSEGCQIVNYTKTSTSKDRCKRRLKISFKISGIITNVHLHVVTDNDLMSRNRTGVWTASSSTTAYQNIVYTPSPQIFDDIGDFEFLQNTNDGSAVTRFNDSNGNENIVGILKQIYTVQTGLEEQSLIICKTAGFQQGYIQRITYATNDSRPHSDSDRLRRQSQNRNNVPDIVHPKLLVVPDFNTVKSYTYVRDFMMQLIAQLNAVDMMFRQLSDPGIHLNIVGIIIPSDNGTTPYISKQMNNTIYGPDAVLKTEINFSKEFRRFPWGKWNSILMLTKYTIRSFDATMGHLVSSDGFSQTAVGCLGTAAIVRFSDEVDAIYTTTQELGKMFGVMLDENRQVKSLCRNVGNYLMTTGYNESAKPEWTNCGRAAIKTYLNSDAGNCTYSRAGEVLDAIKNMPGAWLTIDGQCDNLHNDSTHGYIVDPPHCFPYGCVRNDDRIPEDDSPLDGSLIIYNNGIKACIDGKVVSV